MAGPYAASDSRNYVGFGKEVTKGTGVVPTKWVGYLPSVDLDHGLNVNRLQEASGGYRVTYSEKVSEMPTGRFICLARPSISAWLAHKLLGLDAISGAGPYTHVLTDDLATDYLSAEQNLADEAVERFIDAVVSELTWSVDSSTRAIRLAGQWLGLQPSFQAAATAESYETENPFLITDGAFTVDSGVVTNLQAFTVTCRFIYSLPLVDDVIADYAVKIRQEVDVEITQLAVDIATEYRKTHTGAVGGTTYQKIVQPGDFIADFNYGAGASLRQMKLEVPNLDYDSAAYTPLTPEGDVVSVTRTAHGRKAGGTPLFRYTGQNTDSTDYDA
jgi:hypothetical protein